MTELKPCPACGSKIATPALEYDPKFPQLGYVRCREITCGLKTGLFADGGRHAVEIWNSLPRPDEVRGVGKWEKDSDGLDVCSECGEIALQRVFIELPDKIVDSKMIRSKYCPHCGAKMEVRDG